MADNKLDIEIAAKVTGDERIIALDKKLAALQDGVIKGDKNALKAQKALVNERNSYVEQIKLETKATRAATDATVKLASVEERRRVEARKAAKERRITSEAARAEAAREVRREESAAAKADARERGIVARILRSSRAKREAVLESIKNGKEDLAGVIKRWGTVSRIQRLEEELRARSHKDRVNDVLYLEKLKNRSLANEQRAASVEKRASDSRLRHLDQQKQALNSVNQFMNRQTGLLSYRGSIEEKYASSGLKNLRSSMAASLMRYRADMRQQRAADAASGTYDAAANQRIQNRMKNSISAARKSFNANMAFGRAEQQAENARERYREKVQRDGQRYIERNRQRTLTSASQATSHGGQFLSSARVPAVAAIGAAATAGMAVKQGLSSARQVDTAEANLRIFGSEPAYKLENKDGSTRLNKEATRMTQSQIAKIRDEWLDKAAITNGLQVPAAINAYTEVLKAGIPTNQARGTTELLLEANSAMDLPLQEVTRIVGKIAQNRPNLGVQGTREMLNAMAISAGSTASDPNQIVSGLQRGMGVFAMSNMDPKDLVAMVATGAGAGIQEGKTGNFVAELVSTVMTAGKERGQKRKNLDAAFNTLKMGNSSRVSADGEKDITGTIVTMLKNFKNLNARQRSLVARQLGGREWDDETMQFVNSTDTLERTLAANRDPRNSGYLQAGKDEKMKSWDGMWSRASATFGLFWSKFGKGFDAILHDLSSVFDDLSEGFNFNGATDIVRSALEGIRVALDIETWKEGIQSVLGYGSGGFGSIAMQRDVRKFFKGLTEGLMEVGGYFKSMFSALGVDTTDVAGTGKFAGKVIGLSIALLALAPVLSILGGLASLVLMFARAGSVLAGVTRMAGFTAASSAAIAGAGGTAAAGAGGAAAGRLAGAGAGAAGGMAGAVSGYVRGMLAGGVGRLLSRMFILGLVAEIGSNQVEISAWLTAPIIVVRDQIWEAIKKAWSEGFSGEAISKFMSELYTSTKNAIIEEFVPAPVRRYLNAQEAEKTPEQKAKEKAEADAKNGAGQTLLQRMGITTATPEAPKKVFAPLIPLAPNRPAVTSELGFKVPTVIGPTAPDVPEGGNLHDTVQNRLLQKSIDTQEEIKDILDGTAKVQKQSLQGSGGGSGLAGLIHKASIMSGSTGGGATYSNAIASGGMTGGLSRDGMTGGPLSGSTPGERMNGGGGLGYKGIIGGALSGRGLGPGGGGGAPLGSRMLFGGSNSPLSFGNGPGGMPMGSRMGGGGPAVGPVKDRMKSVYDAFKSAGLSHEAAKSFTAEIGRENDFNPNLMYGSHIDPHNRQRNAGMMSWQGSRATNLLSSLREGGHLNEDGSIKRTQGALNAQAKFALDEMRNGSLGARGQRALSVLNDPNASHAQRALTLGDDVIKWRQHDPRYANHANKRDRYYNQMEGVSSGASSIISSNGSQFDDGAGLNITGAMRNLRAQGAVMNEQCVSLVKAASGSADSVKTWQRGVQATDGTLKPGMAVATFMDSMGRQSSRYAGGGTGTMGANRDHAGIFQQYIKDATGKNIGMTVAEQYKGSGGVHSKDYMFGRGTGAKDGANYAAVLDKDGNVMGARTARSTPGATMSSPYTTPEAQKDPYSFNALKTPEQIAKDAEAKKNLDAWNKFDGFDKSKIFSVPKDSAAVAAGSVGSGWKAGLGPMGEAALKKEQENSAGIGKGWTEGWGAKGKPEALMTRAEKAAKRRALANNPAYLPGAKIPRAADFNADSSAEENADIRSRMLGGMSPAERAAFRKKEAAKYIPGSKIAPAANFDNGKGKLPDRILEQFKKDDAAKKITDAIVAGTVKSVSGVTDAIKKPAPPIVDDIEKQSAAIKGSGWKPKPAEGSSITPTGSGPVTKASLGDSVPVRQPNIQPQMTQAAASGAASGGKSSNQQIAININGANQDAESLANTVQRKLQADMGRRTHDIDHLSA